MTTTGLPFGRPLVRDDLEGLPDDGHRYELLDGTLLVSPAPRLVDPDEPSVTVLELVDGAYVETARATGEQAAEATLPFPVRLVPVRLTS